jgi:nitrous oxide reductase accessory protein NosL
VLRPEELGILVSKITELCPKAFKEMEGEKAQILVDLIDPVSFKAILTTLENLEEPEDVTLKKQKK